MKPLALLWLISIVFEQGLSQVDGYLQAYIVGPVHYVVTDSMGRRAGINPFTGEGFSEIPNAGYGLGGADDHEDPSDPLEQWEFSFDTVVKDPTFKESYTLQVFGVRRGLFHGAIIMSQTFRGKAVVDTIRGVIDSGQVMMFKFSYSTDTTVRPTFRKVVDRLTLRRDLRNCYEQGLLGGEVFFRRMIRRLDQFDRSIMKPDSSRAHRHLLSMRKSLNKAFDRWKRRPSSEKPKRGDQFVAEFAHWILQEDLMEFLDQLPKKESTDSPKEDMGEEDEDDDDD